MAYYDNPGQINDEAISIAGGKTFQVIQLADSAGNIINPDSGELVLEGDVVIGANAGSFAMFLTGASNTLGQPVGSRASRLLSA